MLQPTSTSILDPVANGIALLVLRVVAASATTSTEVRSARALDAPSAAMLVAVPGVATSAIAVAISWLVHCYLSPSLLCWSCSPLESIVTMDP